jgi:hypothetical protein
LRATRLPRAPEPDTLRRADPTRPPQARSQLVRRLVLPSGVLPSSASYQVLCDLPFASGEASCAGNGSYKLAIAPLAAGARLAVTGRPAPTYGLA